MYHLQMQVAQYSALQLLLSLQCTIIHIAICAHTYVYMYMCGEAIYTMEMAIVYMYILNCLLRMYIILG